MRSVARRPRVPRQAVRRRRVFRAERRAVELELDAGHADAVGGGGGEPGRAGQHRACRGRRNRDGRRRRVGRRARQAR